MAKPTLQTLIITVDDAVKAGHCPSGIKAWMDANIEGGARRFWAEGVPASEMVDTGDANGLQVVEATLARLAGEKAWRMAGDDRAAAVKPEVAKMRRDVVKRVDAVNAKRAAKGDPNGQDPQ